MIDHSIAQAETNVCANESPFEIFICYRRSSSAHHAVNLYRDLVEAFGEVIFIDHECLSGGETWRQRIDHVIRHVNTVIVLIGPDWLEEVERRVKEGRGDEVVREIDLALRHERALYPVLLDGAQMPAVNESHALVAEDTLCAILEDLGQAHARPWRACDLQQDMAAIIEDLSMRMPRFPVRFRQRCQAVLAEMLDARNGNQRLRKKFAPLRESVDRPALQKKLDEAQSTNPALLVIHAEEGMGKSIALGRALQSLANETVLLTDAGEELWRYSFTQSLNKLLSRHCSEPELSLAQELPLVVAIDGLNEASNISWAVRLQEALDCHDMNSLVRVIVTVRKEYWQTSIAPYLGHSGMELLNVPPLDDSEFIVLSEKLNYAWKNLDENVQNQLRRPRMLVAASRIPPEELNGLELSYTLLQLFDLKQRGSGYRHLTFEHFVEVLRNLGRTAKGKKVGLSRREIRDLLGDLSDKIFEEGLQELCDAGVLCRTSGKFAVNEGATNVALALHLLKTLHALNSSDHAILCECIRTELADQHDSNTARIVTSAISAIVCERIDGNLPDLDNHDPVLAALLADWLGRYNADDAPVRQAQRLVPELVWLVENTDHRDLEELLASVLSEAPCSHWIAELLDRLSQWLIYVEPEQESGWRAVHKGRPVFEECLRQAQIIVPLKVVGCGEARLRRYALDIATKAALTPSALQLLGPVLSVAVQPDGGWDRLRRWVSVSDADWWLHLNPIWNRISQEFSESPLCEVVARLLRHLWPTPECLATIPARPAPDPYSRMRFVDLAQLSYLSQPGEQPSEEQMDTLLKSTEPKRAHRQVVREQAASLALWVPDRLQEAVDAWAEQAAGDAVQRESFEGANLAEFAPLVSPQHARRLRAAIPHRTDIKAAQLGYLSLVSWWSLPPSRRVAAILCHLSAVDLDKSILRAAPLNAHAASALARRLVRKGVPVASRIAFWLHCTLTAENADALRNVLQKNLPQIDLKSLGDAGQYWLLRLGLELEVPKLAANLVDESWHYKPDDYDYIQVNYARSAALAETGTISAPEVRERCHSDHWHLGCRSNNEELIGQRASMLYDQFFANTDSLFARRFDQVRMKEMVERHPDVVNRVLSSMSGLRGVRAEELARVLAPSEHPRWLDLIEAISESRQTIKRIVNGIDQRTLLAFRASDNAHARTIWDQILETVEHDADLMQLVVAAEKGNGKKWMQERSVLVRSSSPHRQLRAATLAAMAQDASQRSNVESAHIEYGGWMRDGFKRALSLYQADELAIAWYQRFRTASDWYQAYGCWRMHIEHIDLRHLLWSRDSFPACKMPDAERYARTFNHMVDRAISRRSEILKKTRFGVDLS